MNIILRFQFCLAFLIFLHSQSWSTIVTTTTAAEAMASSAAAAATTTTTKKAGLIFLHGLGDGPSGWNFLARKLPALQPALEEQVEFVFPQSPVIPISINGGMRMPGWFDLYEWPIQVGDPDDVAGNWKAIQQMEEEITALERRGIPRNKIAVGGFSQGGAIALLTAYYSSTRHGHAPRPPLAGCVSLSGWLTMAQDIQVTNPQTPLLWGHGKYDDKVVFAQQKFGVEKLKTGGVSDMTIKSYPIGHEGCMDEFQELASFLKRILLTDADDPNREL